MQTHESSKVSRSAEEIEQQMARARLVQHGLDALKRIRERRAAQVLQEALGASSRAVLS